MSFTVRLNNGKITEFISFSEFCNLSESFKPKETEFGTDGKDGKWNYNQDHIWTLFSHAPDFHVMTYLNKKSGEFGFGTHRGEFTTDVANHYDESPKHAGEALSVMNKALHVALVGANEHNLDSIHIKGANAHLKEVYKTALNNKFLQNHLKNRGYEYSHSFRDEHHFKKVR